MKLLLGMLLCTYFFSINFSVSAQNKHALIVAIGDYKPETNWGVLSSANDVPFIKSALEKQAFPAANIMLLQDAAATKKGIENAFTQLLAKVQARDIVVIHFSSHGVQLLDNDGDETDGKDEAIVPYGAIYPKDLSQLNEYVDGYLRDDDFGKFIEALRSKIGSEGNVIVILDACNSGTATRGTELARGGKAALVPPGFKTTNKSTSVPTADFMENSAAAAGIAPYIVFSAARAEETNYEMKNDDNVSMGSLTYAMSKALDNLQPGTSYRSFFANVLSTMNDEVPNQNPVIEGSNLDQGLFAGNMVYQKPYIEIKKLEGNTLILKGGKIEGLDAGTKVALHKSGTTEPTAATLLAKGTVTAAESFTSTVVLETADVIAKESDGWIFITEPMFKSDPLVVAIVQDQPGSFSASQVSALQSTLQSIPAVKTAGNPELWITHGSVTDSIIIAANGLLFGTFKNMEVLQDQLKHYIQYKFLKSLEIKDPAYDLEVRLLPVINGKVDTSRHNPKIAGGILELEEGDKFYISAKNNTNRGLYVNILDLQPDGLIHAVFPNRDFPIEKTELRIEAGQERIFSWLMNIGPPFGMETYKIFVSRQEIDMETIARSNGGRPRANLSSLQELVNDSFATASRGSSIEKSTEPDGSVYSIVFKIKPAQKK